MSHLCLVCCCFWAADAHAPVGGAPPAQLSAAEIRERLGGVQRSIHSLRVVYSIQHESKGEAGQPRRVFRTIALRAPDRAFVELAHETAMVPREDDPYKTRTYLSADSIVTVRPFARQYSEDALQPDEPLPPGFDLGHYIRATGVWPLSRPMNDNGFKSLRDIAASDDFSVVRPVQEQLAGVWCHVLEHRAGLDALWVDVDRTLIMARERFTDEHVRIARFEYRDHQLFENRVGLPRSIETWKFDVFADNPSDRQRIVQHTALTVQELSLNDVPDATFACPQPPGSIRREAADVLKQTHAGGLDLLDETAAWLRRYFGPVRRNGGGRFAELKFLLPCALALALLVSGEVQLWRRRRGRQFDPTNASGNSP